MSIHTKCVPVCCTVVRLSYVSAILGELLLPSSFRKNQMPDTKATTQAEHPAATTLKDKAPPKPRRLSSIPPALVVSATASRIPPAPRAPRPPTRANTEGAPTSQRSTNSRGPSSRPRNSRPQARLEPARSSAPPQTWELDEGRGNTLRGVAAATPPPTPQRDGAIALVGVSMAAALLGGWWFLREPAPATSSSRVKAAVTEQAAPDARPTDAAPAPKAATTRSTPPARVAEPALANAQPELSRSPSNAAASSPARPNDTDRQPSVDDDHAAPSAAPEAARDAAVEADTAPATAASEAEAPAPAALPAFDAEAAKRALGASSFNASSCRKGDDPRGTAEVIVTFAPSGRVTSANVNGAPFGGTATGGCIAATLRSATVPAFAGNHVTVRKLVTVR